MLSRVAIAAGSAAAGAVLDRLAHRNEAQQQSQPQPQALPQRPPHAVQQSGTGNERLGRLSGAIRGPMNDSPFSSGIHGQLGKMQQLGEDAKMVAQNPVFTAEELKQLKERIQDDAKATFGAAKMVSGHAPLTTDDAARLGKAAVKDAVDNFDPARMIESAKKAGDAAYAAATTSKEGIDEVSSAMQDRMKFEAKATAAGTAAVHLGATAISMLPFPGAPLVGAAVRTVGTMAAGAHMSATMREIGGEGEGKDSALRREATRILIEKSGSEPGSQG
ncbi:hypothetical protein [Duganella sp. Root1480D1]|uniref:hypothetical protein n=1 Tax=Duganella sp. Root1480D1 TaxID=1736471 RepID=UPI000A8C9651|nr:hypothetical protein [Duganella sp. Root1480D1]